MKTTFLILFLLLSILGKSQVSKTINVGTAGSLSTLLTEGEKSTITDLTVTGAIDARDIKCMRDQIVNLKNLDLSNANIVAFDGDATSSGSYSYPANEMPRLSFYNGSSAKAKKNLVSILLPNSLTSIGEYAFYLCENIKSIYIGNSITNIGSESFKGSGLTTVTMGNSVTTIQPKAFEACSGLKNITFSQKITYIGEDAFSNTMVDKVVFPNSLTTINDAFRECDNLTEVILPATVTSITNWAFEYCYGLKTIFSLNTTPPGCGAYSFYLIPNVTSVYVPASSVNAYKAAPGWGDNFYSVIKAIPTTEITSFRIPNQIGSATISEVNGSISVKLPYGTTINNLIAIYTLSAGATAKVGTTVQISGTTVNDFTSPVVYKVTSEDGLTTKNWTVSVQQITGINSILMSLETKVFPNPSESIFYLWLKSSEYANIKIEAINYLGKVVFNKNVGFRGEKNELIDLSHATKGIYLLRISTNNSYQELKLLLK